MAQHGHKRDAEIKAMCDYCSWLFDAVAVHDDDADLCSFARRCQMLTLRELMREREATGEQIYNDRIADCVDCRAVDGFRMCIDPDTGKYRGCKWYKGKPKVDFVKANFGEQATGFLEKYKDVKSRRVK